MKCSQCKYYKSGLDWNECTLIGWENYIKVNNCKVVNYDCSIDKKEFAKDCY